MEELLQDYKYKLLGKMEDLALGNARAGNAPSLPAIKQLISIIDDGHVLGIDKPKQSGEGGGGGGLTEEDLRRLGLIQD